VPKIVDHKARREEILAECFNLFAQQGYAALTMREIANALNVSTGTLYHYFDGKPALFKSMFQWIGETDAAAAATEIPADLDLDKRLVLLRTYLLTRAEHLTRAIRVGIDFQRHNPNREGYEAIQIILVSYRDAIRTQLGLEADREINAILSYIFGCLLHHEFDPSVMLDEQLSFISLISSVS
jgi:AcrR family transcriptional regulator